MDATGTVSRHEASFRDPAGFVFVEDGVVYRQVNETFAADYRQFINSGLYAELTAHGLLVAHEEVAAHPGLPRDAHAILRPRHVPFISYPYEWCFGQLKAAALLTLEVQKRAMARGLVLRDASAYNVQFVDGRPLFIDTLSIGTAVDGEPWAGYRQFCQHFLAPLALKACTHPSLGRLLQAHVDGIPLDVAAALLPVSTRLRFGLLTHIHLHARSITRRSQPVGVPAAAMRQPAVSRQALAGLVDSLEATVRAIRCPMPASDWSAYYANTNYSPAAFDHKRDAVRHLVDVAAGGGEIPMVWDLGSNTGVFSRLAAARASRVISFDADEGAVERLYADCVSRGETRILPLVQDLTNPSPAIGWRGEERQSLLQRGPADLVLALALVHHLAIANNVPLGDIMRWLSSIASRAIVEFVPKDDTQVQGMLALRDDVFSDYGPDEFEAACRRWFRIRARVPIRESCRTLYLLER